MAPDERQATSEHRDRLVGLLARAASLNSSHSLDQLSLELDERLADRRFVSERLFPETVAKELPMLKSHSASSSGSHPTLDYQRVAGNRQLVAATANIMRSRHFALGVQLESDAALQWLASEFQANDAYSASSSSSSSLSSFEQAAKLAEPDWPEQVCRLCRPLSQQQQQHQQQPTPGQSGSTRMAATLDQTNDSNKANNKNSLGGPSSPQDSADLFSDTDQSQRLNLASMLVDATTCSELPDVGNRTNWIRPFVLTLQSSCVIAALALIGILFKCRKSRVSFAR